MIFKCFFNQEIRGRVEHAPGRPEPDAGKHQFGRRGNVHVYGKGAGHAGNSHVHAARSL